METMAGIALSKLRSMIRPFEPKPSLKSFQVSWSEKGIARGAVTELSGFEGSGKTSRITTFLAENPKLRVAWVEEAFSTYPIALSQQGVNLAKVLFIEAQAHAVWSALQCIRSQLFEVLVLNLPKKLGDVDLRRLQLAAEKNEVAVFVLCDEEREQKAWAVREWVRLNRRRASSCARSAS